ncbi:MAG: MBL fold metallo-hydrolase [Vicinamibacterales bacterium]
MTWLLPDRRKWVVVLALLAAYGVGGYTWRRMATRLPPPPREAPAPVGTIEQVADHLWMIPGGGGNTAVFETATGVVVVDPKFPQFGAAVVEQVRRVTATPITHAIATHSHNDHFGGIVALPPTVQVVMHRQAAINVARLRGTGDPNRFEGRPVTTFEDRLTLFDGPDAVDLYFFGPAHTNGDVVVVFRAAGVMHAGDLFRAKRNPNINLPWGGSPAEFPATLQRTIDAVPGVSRVITGHSTVVGWQDFVEYSRFVNLLVRHVRSEKDAGRPWNVAMRSFRPPPEFSDYDLSTLFGTVQDIYKGLTPWWNVWE